MQTVKLNNGVEMPILGYGTLNLHAEKQSQQMPQNAFKRIGYGIE